MPGLPDGWVLDEETPQQAADIRLPEGWVLDGDPSDQPGPKPLDVSTEVREPGEGENIYAKNRPTVPTGPAGITPQQGMELEQRQKQIDQQFPLDEMERLAAETAARKAQPPPAPAPVQQPASKWKEPQWPGGKVPNPNEPPGLVKRGFEAASSAIKSTGEALAPAANAIGQAVGPYWDWVKKKDAELKQKTDELSGGHFKDLQPGEILDTAKKKVWDPYLIEPAQKYIGKPLVEASIALEKKVPLSPLASTQKLLVMSGKQELADSIELMKRSALQWFAGSRILEDMDEQSKMRAVTQLEETMGSEGAAFTLGVAQYTGELPLMFIGNKKVAALAEAMPSVATRVMANAAYGGATNAIAALVQPGASVSEAFVVGAVPGAAISGLAEAGKAGAKAATSRARTVAMGTRQFADDLAEDVMRIKLNREGISDVELVPDGPSFNASEPSQLARIEQGGPVAEVLPPKPKGPVPVTKFEKPGKQARPIGPLSPETSVELVTSVKDKGFDPSYGSVGINPETGKLEGRLVQVTKYGRPRVYIHEIENAQDALRFKEAVAAKRTYAPITRETLRNPKLQENGILDALIQKKQWSGARDVIQAEGWENRTQASELRPAKDLDELPTSYENEHFAIIEQHDGIKVQALDSLEYKLGQLQAMRDHPGSQMLPTIVDTPNGKRIGMVRYTRYEKFPSGVTLPVDIIVPLPEAFGIAANIEEVVMVPDAKRTHPSDLELQRMLQGAGPDGKPVRRGDGSMLTPAPTDAPVGNKTVAERGVGMVRREHSSVAGNGPNSGARALGVGTVKKPYAPPAIKRKAIPGGGSGPPKEPPPPPPGPPEPVPRGPAPLIGDLTSGQLAILKPVQRFEMEAHRNPDLWKKVIREFAGGHARAGEDLAQLINLQRSVKNLEASRNELFKNLERRFGKKLLSDFDKDLKRYFERDVSTLTMEKYGPLWAEHKQFVDDVMMERDFFDKKNNLLSGGAWEDTVLEREAGSLHAYVARTYMAHMLPKGEWAKVVQRDTKVWNDMLLWFRRENPKLTDGEIVAEMLSIANAEDPFGSLQGSRYVAPKTVDRLKKRNQLPPEWEAFLGKNQSGMIAIANTLGSQRAVSANLELWKEVANNPAYCIATPTPDALRYGWQPVPNNRWYGAAAGKYVHPDIYDGLIAMPNIVSKAPLWVNEIVGWTKFNRTVGSITPWLNNVFGNLMFSVYAGGLDIAHPVAAGQGAKKAVQAMLAYHKEPTRMNPLSDIVLEARRVGAEGAGYGASEISNRSKYLVDKMLEEIGALPDNASLIDIIRVTRRHIHERMKDSREAASAAYDQIDRFYKLANWIVLVDRYKANPQKYLPPGTAFDVPADVDEVAKRLAARRITLSFPMPDRLPPAAMKMRQWSGWLNPFGMYQYEGARIHIQMPGRLMDPQEKDLKWRLMRWGVFMGALLGTGGLMRQRFGGLTDEQIEAAEAKLPANQRSYRPGRFYVRLDEEGRPEMWDATQYWDPIRYLAGDPDTPWYGRCMGNFLKMPIDGSVLEDVFDKVVQHYTGDSPRYQAQARPGEEGAIATAQFAWKDMGLLPQAPQQLYEVARKMEMFGSLPTGEERLTTSQGVMKSVGLPVVGGVGQQSLIKSVRADLSDLHHLKAELHRIAKMKPDQALPLLQEMQAQVTNDGLPNRQARIEAIVERMRDVAARLQKRGDAINKAQPPNQGLQRR